MLTTIKVYAYYAVKIYKNKHKKIQWGVGGGCCAGRGSAFAVHAKLVSNQVV